MKLIIAGGRDYHFTHADLEKLNGLLPSVSEVVSGGCPTGADWAGEKWAEAHEIPVSRFPANWGKHGRAAGLIRNREMARYANALAVFPGGRGTKSMVDEAKLAGLHVYDFREPTP